MFFNINKYENWNYSLKISFSFEEPINYLNLFLIIKSYTLNKELPPYALCTLFTNEDGNEIITQRENIKWFIHLDYYSFINWINFRIEKDEKYNNEEKFYGLIIIYPKTLHYIKSKEIKNDILEYLKPDYPWKPEW